VSTRDPARQEQDHLQRQLIETCGRFGLTVHIRADLDSPGYYVRTPIGRFVLISPTAPASLLIRGLLRHVQETAPDALPELVAALPRTEP